MKDVPESPESGSAYVDEIMEREAEIAAQAPRQVRRRKNPVPRLIVLSIALIGLTAWNVARRPTEPDAAAARRETAAELYEGILLAIDEIETYRDSTGRLPPDLITVGVYEEDVTYTLEGNAYTLQTGLASSVSIIYRDGEDTAPLEGALEAQFEERK